MKTIILILFLVIGAYAQTVSPTPRVFTPEQMQARSKPVTIDQGYLDDSATAFNLVVVYRDALEKEQAANTARGVTNAALAAQLAAANGMITLYERGNAIYESLITLDAKKDLIYEQALKIEQSIIDSLSKQLGRGDSAWKKFANGVKHAVEIIIAYAVGRAVVH